MQRCLAEPPVWKRNEVVGFCDFSNGGAESALAVRDGNRLVALHGWHERDPQANVGRFIQLFRQHQLKSGQLFGDVSGIGTNYLESGRLWGVTRSGGNSGERVQ